MLVDVGGGCYVIGNWLKVLAEIVGEHVILGTVDQHQHIIVYSLFHVEQISGLQHVMNVCVRRSAFSMIFKALFISS